MPNWIDLILHWDKKLGPVLQKYGPEAYLVLFLAIFLQSGVVLGGFCLPGDTLLFAVGYFSHPDKTSMNPYLLAVVLILAGFTGNAFNYFVGGTFGHTLFRNENARFFKRSHLEKTHELFEKRGNVAMVLAPFIPVVRTFAPFAAGLAKMPFQRFIGYSQTGMALWVCLFLFAGYYLGEIPVVKNNVDVAVVLILIVTGTPFVIEVWKGYKESKAKNGAATSPEG